MIPPSRPIRSALPGLVLLAVLLLSCRPSSAPPAPGTKLAPAEEAAVLERGQAITAQAFGLLSTNLARALREGGVSNALPYCSERAHPLTDLVAATHQVSLRRVTHRPRNPANAASAAELDLLRGFQRALGRGETLAPVVRAGSEGQVTYYSPIVLTNPLCLQCHGVPGQDLTAPTLALLQTLYPNDQATGFRLGELRGLWRVDFGSRPVP